MCSCRKLKCVDKNSYLNKHLIFMLLICFSLKISGYTCRWEYENFPDFSKRLFCLEDLIFWKSSDLYIETPSSWEKKIEPVSTKNTCLLNWSIVFQIWPNVYEWTSLEKLYGNIPQVCAEKVSSQTPIKNLLLATNWILSFTSSSRAFLYSHLQDF